ncbi:DeoR/GlpR family DNA-binding transcription regulator [Paenibacillus sedimenti]|uniref:DeoR/GlpR family DNA-binding transcription regulator n=1 Tax=Paenibacillus sedimenti TaxID=2770274 RepID=UPI00289820A2|nr:DeoR/GlpR family DNA-binding transcription regulator [Paenibacillus sedimenti]
MNKLGSNSLFNEERRNQIVALLEKEGRVEVKRLAALFGVTEDSIRKDLRALESRGLLQKAHGGAVPVTRVSGFVPYQERGEPERKRPIARAAVALIQPGDTVFIESSSYTHLMFYELGNMPDVTVVTNSIYGLPELVRRVNLIQLGGTVHKQDEACYGPFTLYMLSQINFDKCFLKPAGITEDGKLTTGLQESLAVKQTALKQSERTIVLVDEQDWGRRDVYNVCAIDAIHTIVTNGLPEALAKKWEKKGIAMVKA